MFARRNRRMMEMAAVAITVVGMLTSFTTWDVLGVRGAALLPLLLLPTVLLVTVTLVIVWRTGQQGSQVQMPPEAPTAWVHHDDDRYWLAGQIYVNP